LREELLKLSPARLSVRLGEVEIEFAQPGSKASRQAVEQAVEDAGFDVMVLLKEQKIEEVKRYIREHLSNAEALRLSLMSHALATSPFHLSRTFSVSEGETLQDFINRTRMELAGRLLRETQRTVLDICSEVGLSSPSHFTRQFKHYFGQTPLAHRKTPRHEPRFFGKLVRGARRAAGSVLNGVRAHLVPSSGSHFR
jgi:AraC-like DNA-binding protein